MSTDLRWQERIGCPAFPNARILPHTAFSLGGVCREDGSFIESSAFHEELYDGSYGYREEDVVHKASVAVFLGTWHKLYGHRFTDNIKKLWFLFTPEYQELCREYADRGGVDLIYNYMWGGKADESMDVVLATLGLDVRGMSTVCRVTEYDRLYIPDNSFIQKGGLKYYTPEYADMIERICRYCNQHTGLVEFPRNIYLSRSRFPNPKDFGDEISVERAFAAHGYDVVYPEDHSFVDQVAMMQHCDRLASTEGSISHNSVFCRKGTDVVILRKTGWINPWQGVINVMKELNVTYIRAHHSLPSRISWEGPFFVWKTRYVMDFLGDAGQEECRWKSVLWYRYLWNHLLFQLHPVWDFLKRVKYRFWELRRSIRQRLRQR